MSTKVGKHGDVEIELLESGQFSATVEGSTLRDKTLAGLKGKLDNAVRSKARAAAVPAIGLELDEEWANDDDGDNGRVLTATWYEGTFAGINAHTGDISFTPKGGKDATKLHGGVTFFRANDPALEKVRELVAEATRTANLARKARTAAEKAMKLHGYELRLGRYSGRGGRTATEHAAAVERELMTHLGAE